MAEDILRKFSVLGGFVRNWYWGGGRGCHISRVGFIDHLVVAGDELSAQIRLIGVGGDFPTLGAREPKSPRPLKHPSKPCRARKGR